MHMHVKLAVSSGDSQHEKCCSGSAAALLSLCLEDCFVRVLLQDCEVNQVR